MKYYLKMCPKCNSQKINWRWLCLNCNYEPTLEDTDELWGIQVFVGEPEDGEFKLIHPTGGEPYRFPTQEQAEHMKHICYPQSGDKVRVRRLDDGP